MIPANVSSKSAVSCPVSKESKHIHVFLKVSVTEKNYVCKVTQTLNPQMCLILRVNISTSNTFQLVLHQTETRQDTKCMHVCLTLDKDLYLYDMTAWKVNNEKDTF